jgi:hypothetical protein
MTTTAISSPSTCDGEVASHRDDGGVTRNLTRLIRARRRRAAVLALWAHPLAPATPSRGVPIAIDPADAPNLPAAARSLNRAMNNSAAAGFSPRNLM